MRLQLVLPRVDPKAMPVPSQCAYTDCLSRQVRLHQPVSKALRDTVHQQVEAHRYRCLKSGRTFRVYPAGVTSAHRSQRVKGLAVMAVSVRTLLWRNRLGLRRVRGALEQNRSL